MSEFNLGQDSCEDLAAIAFDPSRSPEDQRAAGEALGRGLDAQSNVIGAIARWREAQNRDPERGEE